MFFFIFNTWCAISFFGYQYDVKHPDKAPYGLAGVLKIMEENYVFEAVTGPGRS